MLNLVTFFKSIGIVFWCKLRMDYQLKGLILNCTLKSYAITPTESANVLKVTMKFYGGYKYKSPRKRRRDRLRKKKFLAKFRKDPVLVPVPFLEPGQSYLLGWASPGYHEGLSAQTGP